MNSKSIILCFVTVICFSPLGFSQVGINTDGSAPVAGNILHVKGSGNNSFYVEDVTGNVGINTVPTSTLDVNGLMRVRAGNPSKYKVMSAIDGNGNALWEPARSLKYPDGVFPMRAIDWRGSLGQFTIPAGYNFYITSIYSPGNYSIFINGLTIAFGLNNYHAFNTFECPMVAGPGDVISFSSGSITISGFLADAYVTPVTTNGSYTVPSGHTFVVTGLCSTGGLNYLTVNGAYHYYGLGNYNSGSANNFHGIREPMPFREGRTIYYTNNSTINGYLIPN